MTPQTKTLGRENSSAILETKINIGITDGTACSRLFSSILLVDVQTTLARYKSSLSLFKATKNHLSHCSFIFPQLEKGEYIIQNKTRLSKCISS